MGRSIRIVFAACLLAASVSGSAQGAGVFSVCQGTFTGTGSTQCTFYLAGASLTVYGEVGLGSVGGVEVSITDVTGTIYLMYCVGAGYSCRAQSGVAAPGYAALPAGVPLRCEAEFFNAGSGYYICGSQ